MDNQPLTVGQAAPDFAVMDENKNPVKLADLRGKKVVLLFYPMDCPHCTAEHCSFGPELPGIQGGPDTVVFGVSATARSRTRATRSSSTSLQPVADPARKMAKAYGMWAGEEPYNCTRCGTVVIGKDGKIAYYQEVPMREARNTEELKKIVARAGA